MIWKIRWTKSSFKALKKLQKSEQKRIFKKLDEVKIKPDDFINTLTNRTELKLRIVDTRLFLEIDRGQLIILVLRIGNRKNIYKN